MTHQDLLESAAAYALGALDGPEKAEFEAHLPGCASCKAEVDAYREVAGLLAHAATAVQPPNGDALRHRILSQATAVRPISAAPTSRRRSTAPLAWIAAAASFLLAVGAGLSYRAERARVAALEGEVADGRTQLAVRDSTIAAFLGPEVHVVSLAQPDKKPSARVFWNHTRQIFIVTAFNVPPAPAGKTYQLWALRKGKAPLSMGTFNTDASGRATAILAVAKDITDGGFIDDCGLTLEPDGGSPQPTEAPRLIGGWRHVD
jgi:anti-sigma-K factor RskA